MSDTLNDWFNSFVELSRVVLSRLTELPVVYVTLVAMLGMTCVYLLWRLVRRFMGRAPASWRRYFVAMAVVFVVGVIFLLDRKIADLQDDIGELTYYVRATSVANRPGEAPTEEAGGVGAAKSANSKSANSKSTAPKSSESSAASRSRASLPHRLIPPAELDEGLKDVFPDCDTNLSVINRAIEFASIRSKGRDPAACYVTVIDLTDPGITIEITDKITSKSMTSAFAQERGCAIAINGEAGNSPALKARLGRYSGICISKGKSVSSENDYGRPMLCFDRKNRARYLPRNAEFAGPTEDMYNVIWGREDLLNNGEYFKETSWRWTRRDPRTLMGIDADGTRLILMVVDGRQRGYSEGLGLPDCAALMRLFGAHHAMRCDQGGSSAMYLGTISKIVTRPSDGKERPTYTHFGVSFAE